jgi:hypothetical protein
MMRNLICLTILILLFFSCDRNFTGIESTKPGVKIIVKDENGNPLSSVNCCYIYYFSDQSIVRNPAISFSLTENDTTSLFINHPLMDNRTIIFQDKAFPRGNHSVIINSSQYQLTNGIYQYELILKNTTISGYLPVVYDVVDTLIQYPPLIRSGNDGEIFLPYKIFHVGENFGSENNQRLITDSINIILYKNGYATQIKPVLLNSDKSVDLNIKMY